MDMVEGLEETAGGHVELVERARDVLAACDPGQAWEILPELVSALDPPCVEDGQAHEWGRRVAQTMVWSELRNRVEGDVIRTESWNRWRVVQVCDRCGNPRVLDEWAHDK